MSQPFHNTWGLFRALLRRDWLRLLLWVLLALGWSLSGAAKLQPLADPRQLPVTYQLFQNPAMLALLGPTSANAATYSFGAFFGQTMTLLTAVLLAVIAIIWTLNRTRRAEEEGTAEVFRSFQVGRLANSAAVLIELVAVHLLIGLSLGLTLQGLGYSGMTSLGSNLLFAFSLAAQGLLWGLVGLTIGQLTTETSTAKSLSLGLLGLLYVIQMAYESRQPSLGWANPLSWVYLTDVYVRDNWLPVLLTCLLSLVLVGLAAWLEAQRDTGSGYLASRRRGRQASGQAGQTNGLNDSPRPGRRADGVRPDSAHHQQPGSRERQRAKGPQGIISLVLRLQRRLSLAWAVGIFVLGLVYGSIFGQVGQFISGNATIAAIIREASGHSLQESFLALVVVVTSLLAACGSLTGLLGLVGEERRGRQEQVFASATGRGRVYAAYVGSAMVTAVVLQLVGLIGLYLGSKTGVQSAAIPGFWTMLGAGLVWLAAVWAILGVGTALMGWLPRLSALAWLLIAYALVDVYLGRLLKLSGSIGLLDVYHYVPQLPLDPMSWGPVSSLLGLTALLVGAGWLGYRRRDLING